MFFSSSSVEWEQKRSVTILIKEKKLTHWFWCWSGLYLMHRFSWSIKLKLGLRAGCDNGTSIKSCRPCPLWRSLLMWMILHWIFLVFLMLFSVWFWANLFEISYEWTAVMKWIHRCYTSGRERKKIQHFPEMRLIFHMFSATQLANEWIN